VLWNLFKSLIDKRRIRITLYNKVLSWNWLVNINDLIEWLPDEWYTTRVIIVNSKNTVPSIFYNKDKKVIYTWNNILYFREKNKWKVNIYIDNNVVPYNIENKFWKENNISNMPMLVIATSWDVIIWPNASVFYWVIIAKWNLIILPSNKPFRLYWALILWWKVLNYKRNNLYNLNFIDFSDNYKK